MKDEITKRGEVASDAESLDKLRGTVQTQVVKIKMKTSK